MAFRADFELDTGNNGLYTDKLSLPFNSAKQLMRGVIRT